MRPLKLALAAALFAFSARAATLEVQVANANGSTVDDAVVYAIPSVPIPVGHKVAIIDQVDRQFVPHVLPVQTGTWVEFPNSDNVRHQVYSVSPVKQFQLPLYSGKPAYPVQFANAGVVPIGCNIHELMSAYIVVVDTPYFGKTVKGRASLAGLQPGQYAVKVWYPGMREEPAPQSVVLAATDTRSLSFVTRKR